MGATQECRATGEADTTGLHVEATKVDGEEGATVRCTGTPEDTVGDLDVTETSVDGLRVNFDVQPAG